MLMFFFAKEILSSPYQCDKRRSLSEIRIQTILGSNIPTIISFSLMLKDWSAITVQGDFSIRSSLVESCFAEAELPLYSPWRTECFFVFPVYRGSGGGNRQEQDGREPEQRTGEEFGVISSHLRSACLLSPSLPFLPTSQTKAASFLDNAACVRSERSGNVHGDLLCVTNVNPKPYRSRYICFGFVRSTEGRGVHSMVKGQTTCHISLPSLATTEGCIQRKGWY